MAVDLRQLRAEEVGTLVRELWLPFAEEMAALDSYNELAEGAIEDALSYRQERVEEAGVATFVAEDGGELVGYTEVERREPPPVFERGPEGHVSEVYVVLERRREGIGARLLERAEDRAREWGCTRVTLSVNAANGPARELYEQRGYEVRRLSMDRPLE